MPNGTERVDGTSIICALAGQMQEFRPKMRDFRPAPATFPADEKLALYTRQPESDSHVLQHIDLADPQSSRRLR